MSAANEADAKDAMVKMHNQRINRIRIRTARATPAEKQFQQRVAGGALPVNVACAALQHAEARRDCADQSDRGKIPSSRKEAGAREFRRVRKFLRDRAPSTFARRCRS